MSKRLFNGQWKWQQIRLPSKEKSSARLKLPYCTPSVLYWFRMCDLFWFHPAGRPAVPSKSGNLTIDLMTVLKLPKKVSKNVPNPVVGGGTRCVFVFSKCPKPRGSRVYAKVFLSSKTVPNLVVGGGTRVFFVFKKCPTPRGRGWDTRFFLCSKNVPSLEVGGGTRGFFEVQKMFQTLW